MDGFRPCKFLAGCGHEVCVPEFCDAYDPKIETNADLIRAMDDEELCRFLEKWVRDDLWARDWGERLWWLQQPCEDSPTVEKG